MPAPKKKPFGRNGFKYKPAYGLVVRCKSEQDQKSQYAKLTSQGYKVKVVCV